MKLLVDSGATKADWIALDENGDRLFTTQTLGLSPEVIGKKEALERLKARFDIYNNRNDIRGIGIEIMGGMGKNGKILFKNIAERIAMRSNLHESVILNQIRSKFVSILWKNNTKMIHDSFIKYIKW